MLQVGNAVTHPMFPEWGRGIIVKIFLDNETGNHIAKVMWQNLFSEKLPLHTLSHLRHFVEGPVENTPEQLTLKWD